MIEVWFSKAWNRSAPARRELETSALSFLKRFSPKKTGIVLTITAPLLVIGWHLAALTERQSHLDEISYELGSSVRNFFESPIPDNSCDCLLFIQSGETGFDLYFSR